MKILIVSSVFPAPPDKGDRNRIFHFLRQLSRRHEVDLVTVYRSSRNEEKRLPDIKELCRTVTLVGLSQWGLYARAARALLRPVSVYKGAYPEARLRRAVRAARADRAHDVALLYQLRAGAALPELEGLPVVTDFTDCLHLLFDEYANSSRNSVKSMFYRRESRNLRVYEKFIGSRSFASLVTAELDARGLIDAGVNNTALVQNGVEIPETVTDVRRPSALFIGDPGFKPNGEAVAFIAEKVWPLVLRERPDAVVHFVGHRRPALEKRYAGEAGLLFTGPVRDLAAAYGEVAVCLVPIFTGTGIKNKLLEGLAHGKVVVATEKAALGLPLKSCRELFIENTPGAFARRILEAFADPESTAEMRRLGRAAMLRDFSWEAKTRELENILASAARAIHAHPQ